MSMMADGCCSAVSPCSHQQRDPTTLCETCRKAALLNARRPTWDDMEKSKKPAGRKPPLTPPEIARAVHAEPSLAGLFRVNPTMRQRYDFPTAMDALLSGERISRAAWPLGDFITIVRVPTFQMQRVENLNSNSAISHIDDVQLGRQILRRSVAYNVWLSWTFSNEDIFEKDWIVYG